MSTTFKAVLWSLSLALPFFYTGLLVAYPEMTVPVVLGTVGLALMIGIYPVLMWIDSSDYKEVV